MSPMNVLFIMSDQHQGKASGCYGHAIVKTPNIDGLASSGTRFTSAYTNAPICMPARASLATGKYTFQTGYWDNGHPYDGAMKSWHHMLGEHGVSATSIGKLHFRNETDDTGFHEQIIPMHAVAGKGDVRACVKRPMIGPMSSSSIATDFGPGDSPYLQYDANIADKACDFLKARAADKNADPFCAFVSFVCPHPPYIAPPEFYALYEDVEIPTPKLSDPSAQIHPWLELNHWHRNYDDFVTDETRPQIIRSYFGTTSYLDHNVGRVLSVLDETGLRDNTLVFYTSDHGENLGTRRGWGKSNMYEEACNIPMIVSGPDVPTGKVSDTAVTLVDVAPTILEAFGLSELARDHGMPGQSLVGLAKADKVSERVGFAEYEAAAADRAAFMIRKGKHKLIWYVGFSPELFDLEADPEELQSVHEDPAYSETLAELEAELRNICDPEVVDEAAYQSQCARVEEAGGREAVMTRGKYQGTPAPGHAPVYMK